MQATLESNLRKSHATGKAPPFSGMALVGSLLLSGQSALTFRDAGFYSGTFGQSLAS
jgi:hypothetical protein